ncbi:hypothetical protein [Pseudomonas sp.]|uniref:hypothetical protein n=1 Tax=Pseudomonas sp. TaxID=306 RepID=UPI0028A71124|nr:hypothetical protein [Pseudomonas sp.]
MYPIRVEWLPTVEGGRKTVLGRGSYYPIARFPEDDDWPDNAWSVALELNDPFQCDERTVSIGMVKFLMKNAPEEKLQINKRFEIYEGPQKVADVFLLPLSSPTSL